MNYDVKKFIEDNIDLIDTENFYELYRSWYNDAFGYIEDDNLRIDELHDVLYTANITSLKDTNEIRKTVLHEEIDRIIQDWIDNIDMWIGSSNWIGFHYIMNDALASWLGLDMSVVKEIVTDVAISKNLVADGGNTGWYLKR